MLAYSIQIVKQKRDQIMKQTLKETWQQQQKQELDRLLEWAGSQTTLATYLGVAPQVVSNWVGRGRISASEAIRVEELTKGLFTKKQLRPDVNKWRNE
jgi:DNA-binding transcriptional regulator YdaS (Cro superfamily)